MGKIKSLAQQIAELDEPVAADYDPEENVEAESEDEGSNSGEDEEDALATEHYVDVGKSKLRKPAEVALGPQYAGLKVGREAFEDNDNDEDDDEDEGEDAAQETSEDEEVEVLLDVEGVSKIDLDAVLSNGEDDEDIDSDAAFGEGDMEKFKGFSFRGSQTPSAAERAGRKRKTAADFMPGDSDSQLSSDAGPDDLRVPERNTQVDDMRSESSRSEDELDEASLEEDDSVDDDGSLAGHDDRYDDDDDDSEDEDMDDAEDDEVEKTRRAEVRRLMNDEQKTVIATISQAAKADAEKGHAVKQQRKAFDSLLNVRIRLQKALVATNSMEATDENEEQDAANGPYKKAEEAAIKLLNTLATLRQELDASTSSTTGQKRKRSIDTQTSSETIWQGLKDSEAGAIPVRRATLEKWSSRIKGATAMPSTRKFSSAVQQTITDVLDEQLAIPDRLIKRTRMPRSCAPIQAKARVTEDDAIFDDADFYQLLLKELVDQRMVDANSSAASTTNGQPALQWTAVKEAKTRKNVDTKASKGRKMRFTVHEKLQNFMAPEDRSTWEQDAIDRFFGTLLGQSMHLREDVQDGSDAEEGVLAPEEALMLFRS